MESFAVEGRVVVAWNPHCCLVVNPCVVSCCGPDWFRFVGPSRPEPVVRGAWAGPRLATCSQAQMVECRRRNGRCWQCGAAMLGQLLWGRGACSRPLGGREGVRGARGRGRAPEFTLDPERGGAGRGETAARRSYYTNPAGFLLSKRKCSCSCVRLRARPARSSSVEQARSFYCPPAE